MMKYLITISCMLLTDIVFCQTLALGDIIGFHNAADSPTVETILLDKGFEQSSAIPADLKNNTIMYTKKNDLKDIIVMKIVKEKVNVITSFFSPLVEDYQALRDDIKGSGFEFTRADTSNGIEDYYQKDGFEILLSTKQDKLGKTTGYVLTFYEKQVIEENKKR